MAAHLQAIVGFGSDRPADGPGEQRPRLAARHLHREPRALVQRELEGLLGAIQDVRRGTGDYEHQAVGQAYRDLEAARARHDDVHAALADPTTSWRASRLLRRDEPGAAAALNAAEHRFE